MSERAPHDRSLTWWPIAGAAAVALVGVVAIVAFGNGSNNRTGLVTDASGALTCPKTFTQEATTGATTVPQAWVPTKSIGVDGTQSLVPDTKPQKVTVCHYPAATDLARMQSLTLIGHRTVTSGTAAMTRSLSKAPAAAPIQRPCSDPLDNYLAGFVFPTGAVWVSVPADSCQLTGNGEFQTGEDIRAQMVAAYETGAWQ